MSYTSFIARRYLQFRAGPSRRGFISFLTSIAIVGVTLGVSALIITLTILGGFEKELKEKVTNFTSHIQVTGFQNQLLPRYNEAARRIKNSDGEIDAVTPFAAKEAMVKFGNTIEGVLVKGVQAPGAQITRYLTEGSFNLQFAEGTVPSCAAGAALLRKLGAHRGDTLMLFGLTGSYQDFRQPKIMQFVVGGIYESGMSEYDDVYLFIDLRAAQNLFLLGDAATGFDVMVKDVSAVPAVAERIQDVMGYPYYARTVFQMYRNLFTWIELQKEPIPVILGLIIIVATVNIIGTFLMVVMEKTHQIGILKSMGASVTDIKRIFVYEGMVIAGTGTVLGNAFAFAVCWLQLHFHFFSLPSTIYFMTTVPIVFRWENFAVVSLITIALCAAASYIPSRLAARVDPLRSLRYF